MHPSRWVITLSTRATNVPTQSTRTLSVLPSYGGISRCAACAPPYPFPFGNRLSFLAESCCSDAVVLRTVAHADVDRAAIADDAHTPGGRRLRKTVQKVSRALHLTKNPFAGRSPHLCGVALKQSMPLVQGAPFAKGWFLFHMKRVPVGRFEHIWEGENWSRPPACYALWRIRKPE